MGTTAKHPCFDIGAGKTYGRVHLPVAPKCNVQCNYCNRKYDCVNESRPGVSSVVLTPLQSLEYLKTLTSRHDNLSVVGIAGPGDPMANPEATIETIRLAKQQFPDMIFCLSTNGLELAPHIDTLAELGVTHVTITMNAIDPEILSKVFSWVRFNKKVYRGVEAGRVILEQQLLSLKMLVAKGITVKINSIILPGINEHHIVEVAKLVAEMGAETLNAIPVHPNKDTLLEDIPEPSFAMKHKVQTDVAKYLKPMLHCARCRADAAGKLGCDIPESIDLLQEAASKALFATQKRPYAAVASHEGALVNMHLGEADFLYIYKPVGEEYQLVERRRTPRSGTGDQRWIDLAKSLSDCHSLLVNGIGPNPSAMLKSMGINVVQMEGLIEDGLDAVYKGAPLHALSAKKAFKCGEACGGDGTGC